MTTINSYKSEVEINQNNIFVNDVLFYTDNDNCQRWVVTEVFDGGFEAVSDCGTKDFIFCELQLGWTISKNTKQSHEIHDRIKYAA